tara:strand:- start:37107 stop:37355 length:249 start_codon:yes stop_codon:yes gene_type:complete
MTRDETADSRLPLMCVASHPETGKPIVIRRGSRGYWLWALGEAAAKAFNSRYHVTDAMLDRMIVGCMIGWDAPGARLPGGAS